MNYVDRQIHAVNFTDSVEETPTALLESGGYSYSSFIFFRCVAFETGVDHPNLYRIAQM